VREASTPWPSLGVSTRAGDHGRRQVIDVERGSPAARAGLAIGDVLLSIDGTPVGDREALNRALAGCQWGRRSTGDG
jgi:S1-C subfamily serine protease